ncbi:MAG: condensation domain-containing protein, partial [Acidobacteria bacterium]|nr:condensation domain-containing protein [Acidobacteriota bacterium]
MSPTKRALLEMRLRGQVPVRTKTQAVQRRPEGAGAPLSFAQQRLWFLHQIAPESSVYNVPVALRLEGPLNPSALGEALNGLIRRHEVLRTTFTEVDGQPVATINLPPDESLPVLDLGTLPSAEQRVHVRQLADEEARLPFDLERGSVIRARLLKLSDTAHVLLLTLHHIAVDGWSMHILAREMAELYAAVLNKRPARLPELLIQYADFAHWQRNQLQGDALQRHLTYWARQLSDMPVLNFPTDHPRSLVPAYDGATERFSLSKAITAQLERLSIDAGVTLFTTLLAAFSVILHRYTGQTDLATGTVIASRNRTEIEGLIGFFVNALPLRVNVSGNPKVMELLGRAGRVVQEAYDHQDMPFDKLVQDLELPRDTARNPLFQVSLALGNTPKTSIELAGITIALMDADIGATQ